MSWRHRLHPLHVLAALGGGLFLVAATGPMRDNDVWWHVLIGQEIRSGTAISTAGGGWSFAPVPDDWVTTQWLSEVAMSWVHDGAGWAGLPWARLILAAVFVLATGVALLPQHDPRFAVPVFLLVLIVSSSFFQDRPQSISFVFCAFLARWLGQIIYRGKVPPWLLVIGFTALWANLHPMWVLTPFVLVLAAVARLLDHGLTDRAYKASLIYAGLAVLAGCLTPQGLGGLAAPLAIRDAASNQIGEWQTPSLGTPASTAILCLLVILLVAWARGAERPGRGEIFAIVILMVLAGTANRMLTPMALLMAPMVVFSADRAWPKRSSSAGEAAAANHSKMTAALCLTVLGVLAATAVQIQLHTDPWPERDAPRRIAAALTDQGGSPRVLNGYNVGGYLISSVGQGLTVGIDGRTDRYGADYIDDYQDMVEGRPNWRILFGELAPDIAVLPQDAPLAGLLIGEGWTVEVSDSGYLLLDPPT